MNVVLYTMTHCIRSTLFWMQFKLLFFFKGRLLGLKVRLFRVLHMNSHALAVCPNILQGDKTSFWKENSKEWWITWKRMQTCVTTYAEHICSFLWCVVDGLLWWQIFTHVMISVSSPGSPSTPSTNRGVLVKLYLFHCRPSSKLNLGTQTSNYICGPHWLHKLMTPNGVS